MKISLFLKMFIFSLVVGVSSSLWANHGLVNLRATCYFNAVVQSLLHVGSIKQVLDVRKELLEKDEMFKGLIELSDAVQTAAFRPSDLFNLCYFDCFQRPQCELYIDKDKERALRCLRASCSRGWLPNSFFKTFDVDTEFESYINDLITAQKPQQDAAEFLVKILDSMIEREGKLGLQFFRDLFCFDTGFQFSPCAHCGYERKNTDPKTSLSVPIPAGNPDLNACLASYFQEEIMDGDNQYECYNDKCSKKYDAQKKYFLESAPKVLAISLNRFNFLGNKISTPVPFPLENLNLQEFMVDRSSQVYRLVAFVVHMGALAGGGHYFTYARGQDGNWTLFDDTRVTQNQNEEVRKVARSGIHQDGTPYVLFYERDEDAAAIDESSQELCLKGEKLETSNVDEFDLQDVDYRQSYTHTLLYESEPVQASEESSFLGGLMKFFMCCGGC